MTKVYYFKKKETIKKPDDIKYKHISIMDLDLLVSNYGKVYKKNKSGKWIKLGHYMGLNLVISYKGI